MRRPSPIPRAALLALAAILAAASAPRAQSVDYGQMETLFGEPVTVAATGTPLRRSQVPFAIDIITAEDIRRSGAVDIPGVLRQLAGVDVVRWSTGTATVGLRGYIRAYRERSMLLVNGRQIIFEPTGAALWSTLPVELDEIRQIEVVRGPVSAVYGFNAANGVINIVTWDPLRDTARIARARLGTQEYREASAVFSGRIGEETGLRLSGGWMGAEDSGTHLDPFHPAFSREPRRRSAAGALRTRLAEGIEGGLEISATDAAVKTYLWEPYLLDATTLAVKADIAAETRLGLITATASHTDVSATNEMFGVGATPAGPGTMSSHFTQTVLKLDDSFRVGADNLRVSLEYRHVGVDEVMIPDTLVTSDLWAISGLWEHPLTDSLTWFNAVRLDYLTLGRDGPIPAGSPFTAADYDRSILDYSFNSALRWRLGETDTLRLALGRSTGLPTAFEMGGAAYMLGMPFIGNPYLDPVGLTSAELGWNHTLPELHGALRVSGFVQEVTPLWWVPPDLSAGAIVYRNLDKSWKDAGAEIAFDGRLRDVRLSADYTYTVPLDRPPEIETWYRPRHKLGLGLGYDWGDWQFDVHATWISNTLFSDARGLVRLDPYWVINPRIAWKPAESLTLELTADSLWGHRESHYAEIPRRVFLSLIVAY